MQERPLSLTIVASCMVLNAAFSLYNLSFLESISHRMQLIQAADMSVTAYRTMMGGAYVLLLGSAYGILRGMPIGRLLFLIAFGLYLFVAVSISPKPFATIGGSALFALMMLYWLFRAEADQWFDARGLQLVRNDAR